MIKLAKHTLPSRRGMSVLLVYFNNTDSWDIKHNRSYLYSTEHNILYIHVNKHERSPHKSLYVTYHFKQFRLKLAALAGRHYYDAAGQQLFSGNGNNDCLFGEGGGRRMRAVQPVDRRSVPRAATGPSCLQSLRVSTAR